MSQETVEIVRRAYALLHDLSGFRRGDYDDAFLEYFAVDGEIVPPQAYPDAEPVYFGLDGCKRWLELVDEVFDDWGFEPEQLLDAGDQVVALVNTSGTAKQSGVAVSIPVAHVLTIRGGRIIRLEVSLDRGRALEAAGLSD